MKDTLIIACAHGMGGTGMGSVTPRNPREPWLNDTNRAHYNSYIRNRVECQSDRIADKLEMSYMWKACIDGAISLMESGSIKDFRIFFTLGKMGKRSEKWLNRRVWETLDEEFDNPFVTAVGKSFGGFDVIRAMSGIGRKRRYSPIDTDLMILIDPDESLSWGNDIANIIPNNVARVVNFLQNQTEGPRANFPNALRGHIMGPLDKQTSLTSIENVSFPPDTHFPQNSDVFAGELLNHWTIDEYIPEVGYNGYTLEKLIVDGAQMLLPESLG